MSSPSPWAKPCWWTARPDRAGSHRPGRHGRSHAISPTEIMVNGKAPGETSLIIWDIGGGRQFFNVTVRASTVAPTTTWKRSAAS